MKDTIKKLFFCLVLLLSFVPYIFSEELNENSELSDSYKINFTAIRSFNPPSYTSGKKTEVEVTITFTYIGPEEYLSLPDEEYGCPKTLMYQEQLPEGIDNFVLYYEDDQGLWYNYSPSPDDWREGIRPNYNPDIRRLSISYDYWHRNANGKKVPIDLSKPMEFKYKITIPETAKGKLTWGNTIFYVKGCGREGEDLKKEQFITGEVSIYELGVNQYSLTYDGNGGKLVEADAETVEDPLTHDEGISFKLNNNNFQGDYFARQYHTFLGWGKTADDTATDIISEITLSQDTTVYAIWQRNQVKVTYLPGVGATFDENRERNVDAGAPYTVTDVRPEITNKIFKGWKVGDNSEELKQAGETIDIEEEDVILTAVWEDVVEEKFTLTYDGNGGTLPNGTATLDGGSYIKGTEVTLRANPFTRQYFDFQGWTNSDGDSITKVIINENTTVYAKWEQKTVTVTYNPGEGATFDAETVYTENAGATHTIISAVPQRGDHVFKGWLLNGTAVQGEIKLEEEDVTLVADWAGTAKLVLHRNYPHSSFFIDEDYDETDEIEVDISNATAPENTEFLPNRQLKFIGWSKEDIVGAPVDFAIGAPLELEDGETLHLYAVWDVSANLTLAGLVKATNDWNGAIGNQLLVFEPDTPRFAVGNHEDKLGDGTVDPNQNAYLWFRMVNRGLKPASAFTISVTLTNTETNESTTITSGHLSRSQVVENQEPTSEEEDIVNGRIVNGLTTDGHQHEFAVVRMSLGQLAEGSYSVQVVLDSNDEIPEYGFYYENEDYEYEYQDGKVDNTWEYTFEVPGTAIESKPFLCIPSLYVNRVGEDVWKWHNYVKMSMGGESYPEGELVGAFDVDFSFNVANFLFSDENESSLDSFTIEVMVADKETGEVVRLKQIKVNGEYLDGFNENGVSNVTYTMTALNPGDYTCTIKIDSDDDIDEEYEDDLDTWYMVAYGIKGRILPVHGRLFFKEITYDFTLDYPYFLRYLGNGGTVDNPDVSVDDGIVFTNGDEELDVMKKTPNFTILGENPFINKGYRFIGWNTEADGSGENIEAGSTVYVDSESRLLELYAQWESSNEDATLVLHHNLMDEYFIEGTNEATDPIEVKINEAVAPANNYFKPKFPMSLAGWTDDPTAGALVKYLVGDSIDITANETLDLYAVWKLEADITLAGLVRPDFDFDIESQEEYKMFDPNTPRFSISTDPDNLGGDAIGAGNEAYLWFRMINYGFVDTGAFSIKVELQDADGHVTPLTSGRLLRAIKRYENGEWVVDHTEEEEFDNGYIENGLYSDGYDCENVVVRMPLGALPEGSYTVSVTLDSQNEVTEPLSWIDKETSAGGETDNEFGTAFSAIVITYYDALKETTVQKGSTEVMSPLDVLGYDKKYYGVVSKWVDENGKFYSAGDTVNTSMTLFAYWEFAPVLWMYPLDVNPDNTDSSNFIKLSQGNSTTLTTAADTTASVWVVDYVETGEVDTFHVSITVTDSNGNPICNRIEEVKPNGGSSFKLNTEIGQFEQAGTYTVTCVVDCHNEIEEGVEDDSYQLELDSGTYTTMYKKYSYQFTVAGNGYTYWPEDESLYAPTPASGQFIRETEGMHLDFSWPGIANAESYTLVVSDYSGDIKYSFKTEDTHYSVTGLENGSYMWSVTANGENCLAGATKDSGYLGNFNGYFLFAVIEDNGAPIIKKAEANGTSIDLTFDRTESGYTEKAIEYQILFYSASHTRGWTSFTQRIAAKDGKASFEVGTEAANGYLYIRPKASDPNSNNFIEFYIR